MLDGIVHFLFFGGGVRSLRALQLFKRFHLGGRDIHQRRIGLALVIQHHVRLTLDRDRPASTPAHTAYPARATARSRRASSPPYGPHPEPPYRPPNIPPGSAHRGDGEQRAASATAGNEKRSVARHANVGETSKGTIKRHFGTNLREQGQGSSLQKHCALLIGRDDETVRS